MPIDNNKNNVNQNFEKVNNNEKKLHKKNSSFPKSKKKKIIIGVILGVIVLIIGGLIIISNVGHANTESPIDKLEIDDIDVKQADDYLLNKYNAKFSRTFSKYDSKDLYKSSNTLRISIEYADSGGFKFTYRAHKYDNEGRKMSDNYQCLQFVGQIDNIVKTSFSCVDSSESSATGTSVKFNSLEDFCQNYKEFNFVVYLKQDEFGELNKDSATMFSKKILEKVPFKDCSFMYTNTWFEEKNGINYSRHGNPINISYYNNEFFEPSMEHVQEKADALNKAIDEEIGKSKTSN